MKTFGKSTINPFNKEFHPFNTLCFVRLKVLDISGKNKNKKKICIYIYIYKYK